MVYRFEKSQGLSPDHRIERHRIDLPAGSVRISTDQALCELIVHLLEPEGPNSLWRLGFFRSKMKKGERLYPVARSIP